MIRREQVKNTANASHRRESRRALEKAKVKAAGRNDRRTVASRVTLRSIITRTHIHAGVVRPLIVLMFFHPKQRRGAPRTLVHTANSVRAQKTNVPCTAPSLGRGRALTQTTPSIFLERNARKAKKKRHFPEITRSRRALSNKRNSQTHPSRRKNQIYK